MVVAVVVEVVVVVVGVVVVVVVALAQDKVVSSKGDFLNNILFSYTAIYIYIYTYVCNEINGMCI